ncbi:plasmid mobilization protein [Streptomyces sp. NPDC054933]
MTFTPAEQAAIDAHAAKLGISKDEYIRQSAASRALAWQREQDAFQMMHGACGRHRAPPLGRAQSACHRQRTPTGR